VLILVNVDQVNTDGDACDADDDNDGYSDEQEAQMALTP
jgi:hypothetical protein